MSLTEAISIIDFFVTHETSQHKLIVLSLTKPMGISWVFETSQHQLTDMSLTKHICNSRLICHSRNLFASFDYSSLTKPLSISQLIFHSRNHFVSLTFFTHQISQYLLIFLSLTKPICISWQFVTHKTSQHQPTYVTHETYGHKLIVLSLTKPLNISRHISLTKPIWIGWFLETHKSLSISRHISLTKPVWIGCLFCLSQNLSASADTHKTMFEFGGLWFECYLGWHKLAQHGTFMKWFKQPSWSLCQSDLPPDPARLVTGALQSLKFCPPNSNVELCAWVKAFSKGLCFTLINSLIYRYTVQVSTVYI